jgi:hypothetical protein
LILAEALMAISGLLVSIIALGGCALLAVALLGVVWVIANERRSAGKRDG